MDVLLKALRAAAEPTRLRLLALCADGELAVSELVHILGQSQPRISRHLKLLAEAGLLERFREGSWIFYRRAAAGAGAETALNLIALLGRDDEILTLDRERLAEVKGNRERAAAAYFAANAERWNQLRSLHVDDGEVEKVLMGMLSGQDGGELLDIGTGTGRMLEILAGRADRCHGVDISREMLAVARANLERAGLSNCALRHADMYKLPYQANAFATVTIHQVLHFADSPERAVGEAARVLKPGGRLLVADFAPHGVESLRDEHEHRRLGFADAEVAQWFSAAGLAAEDIAHLPGDPLTVTVWLAQKPVLSAVPISRRAAVAGVVEKKEKDNML